MEKQTITCFDRVPLLKVHQTFRRTTVRGKEMSPVRNSTVLFADVLIERVSEEDLQ